MAADDRETLVPNRDELDRRVRAAAENLAAANTNGGDGWNRIIEELRDQGVVATVTYEPDRVEDLTAEGWADDLLRAGSADVIAREVSSVLDPWTAERDRLRSVDIQADEFVNGLAARWAEENRSADLDDLPEFFRPDVAEAIGSLEFINRRVPVAIPDDFRNGPERVGGVFGIKGGRSDDLAMCLEWADGDGNALGSYDEVVAADEVKLTGWRVTDCEAREVSGSCDRELDDIMDEIVDFQRADGAGRELASGLAADAGLTDSAGAMSPQRRAGIAQVSARLSEVVSSASEAAEQPDRAEQARTM